MLHQVERHVVSLLGDGWILSVHGVQQQHGSEHACSSDSG
jgi:hypothetical protein